ncbi:MAG: glycosyltransferase family 4 protein [Planctomycetota bacterium]|jgi:glycosyltransferase involved in cell wall biosynthesis
MHVAYVLKKFPRLSETFILNEILELERSGVRVTVFSLHRPDEEVVHRQFADLDAEIIYMPQTGRESQLEALRSAWPMLQCRRDRVWSEIEALLNSRRRDIWNVFRWGAEVSLQAKRLGIDRLHAHFATVASYVARAAHAVSGIPFSFTCHAKDIYRSTVDPLQFQELGKDADFVITVCEANRDYIRRHLAGESELPLVVLYNGIELSRFKSRIQRSADELPLLLSVGRLVPKKGFDDLIAAIALLERAGHRFRCVVIGEGEDREKLEGMIADLAVDGVELMGPQPQEVVREYLQRASLFVLPCKVDGDGNRDALPTVLLEALASGVPAISTAVGGIPEILDGGRVGCLAPADDREALASSIAELLSDKAKRDEFSTLGRERAHECFDLGKNVQHLIQLFTRAEMPTREGV